MNRMLTDAQESELVELYGSGVRTKDLVVRFGVSDTTVRNVLRRHEVKPFQGNTRVPVEMEKAIVDAYQDGLCTRGVSEKLGVVKSTVLKVLRRNSIEPRPKAHQKKLSLEQRADVAFRYKSGETYEDLRNEFNVSSSVIQGCLEEHGVLPRVGWAKYRTSRWVDKRGREFLFKSTWELAYARHLDELGLEWNYEPVRFKLEKCRVYTPDFQISTRTGVEYHEVKGWLDERVMSRMFEFVQEYPDVKLKVIGPAEMAKLGLVEECYAEHPMGGVVLGFKKKLRICAEEV